MNSTRRLRSRPAAEVLLAIGLDSPRPTAETIDALTPRRIRAARTASARCVLRTALRPGSPLASVCASIRIGTGVLASAVAMASRVVCAEASSVGLERAKVIGDERRIDSSSVSSRPAAASSTKTVVRGGADGVDGVDAGASTAARATAAVRCVPRRSELPATREGGSAGPLRGRARTTRRPPSTCDTPQRRATRSITARRSSDDRTNPESTAIRPLNPTSTSGAPRRA